MGRPAKPAALKKVDGNPGKRKINEKEINFEAENLVNIKPPEDLNKEAKKMWVKITKSLPEDLLKNVDFIILKSLCIAYEIHKMAYEKIKKEGLITISPNGMPMQNAYLPILNKQTEIMQKLGSQLGLSPVARARLFMEDTQEEDGNLFDNL